MEIRYIGIIGMGEMGRMYARRLSAAGWRRAMHGIFFTGLPSLLARVWLLNEVPDECGSVNVCDRPENYEQIKAEFSGNTRVNVLANGNLVSRISDWIIYSVEAENIYKVVELYGPSTKHGAIVGGQTSCKAPEMSAFEAHLPSDVDIVSCHSLHGPNVDPQGQPLVVIDHRTSSPEPAAAVKRVLSCLGSKFVDLSAAEHDEITADTQAVTHAAFLSMGTAWQANRQFPWETSRYSGGGIENVKINVTLRIYSNKWHVYAGLAILNPSAQRQIRQYADSVTELFKLMLSEQREELGRRVRAAGAAVFKADRADSEELLLEDEVLDRFSLSNNAPEKRPNNHLSLIAMVDCWAQLGIEPYKHMICSTPLFRLWLGATEYLFRKPGLLDEVLRIAIEDHTYRSDDLEFTFAARGWSDCVSFGDMAAYRDRFEKIQAYFAPRFPEATRVGNDMIATILKKTRD